MRVLLHRYGVFLNHSPMTHQTSSSCADTNLKTDGCIGLVVWILEAPSPRRDRILRRGGALGANKMAESSEHTEEDLIPIQNFMRRFSHVDSRDQEPSRQSLIDAAAAEEAKQPTLGQKCKELIVWGPPAPPPRGPTRHDWLLIPILNAKDWLVNHPKTTTAICALLMSTVADKLPYYDTFHSVYTVMETSMLFYNCLTSCQEKAYSMWITRFLHQIIIQIIINLHVLQ